MEIIVSPSDKSGTVRDLCLMAFPRFELDLALQIDVPYGEKALIDVRVEGAHRQTEFGMVRNDLVGRLSLCNKRSDDGVLSVKLLHGEIDTLPGAGQGHTVAAVGKSGIVGILMGDRAMVDLLCAAIADVRSPVKAGTAFLLEIRTGLVTGRAGSTPDTTEDDLAADICFPAMVPVGAEVVGIVKGAFVVPVGSAVSPYLFGDGGGILTEEPCDILEGSALIKFIFDVDAVIEGKVFLVTGDESAHKTSFYCCQKER